MTIDGVSRTGAALVCVGLCVALLASMMLTNPSTLGPTLVTVWFLGFWLVISSCLALVNYEVIMRFGTETSKTLRRRIITSSLRHGLLIGAGLTVLLALSSLQQLDIRDIGLVVVLIILVEFFARTRQR